MPALELPNPSSERVKGYPLILENKTIPKLASKDHIIVIKTLDYSSQIPLFLKQLSPDEHQKADGFLFEDLRKKYIISRGILRLLLGQYLKSSPQTISLGYSFYGKPFVKDQKKFFFNLSHSHAYTAYIFSAHHQVGIDIEYKNPFFDFESLVPYVLTPSEKTTYEEFRSCERRDLFYNVWTLKESFLKARGLGLSHLNEPIETYQKGRGHFSFRHSDKNTMNPIDFNQWTFTSISVLENYSLAVSIHQKKASFVIQPFDLFARASK